MSSVAKALDTSTTNVLYACNGKSVSCRGLYFRTLDNNIEVTMEDLNELRLEEYDKMCGVSRVYYETKDMSRTGKLTKKKNK